MTSRSSVKIISFSGSYIKRYYNQSNCVNRGREMVRSRKFIEYQDTRPSSPYSPKSSMTCTIDRTSSCRRPLPLSNRWCPDSLKDPRRRRVFNTLTNTKYQEWLLTCTFKVNLILILKVVIEKNFFNLEITLFYYKLRFLFDQLLRFSFEVVYLKSPFL